MPIQISNFKVFDQINNGKDFTLNTGTFNTGVNGNVQKELKVTFDVEIEWSSAADANNEFTVDGNTVTNEVGSFIADGFAIGDTIDIDNPDLTTIAADRVITFVSDDTIIFDGAAVTPVTSQTVVIKGKNAIQDFLFRYDFPSTAESTDYLSRLTQRKLEWKAENVTVGGSFEAGTWSDIKNGANFGSFQIRHNGFSSTYVQSVSIEHVFLIESYWLDGQSSNLTNIIEPAYLSGYNYLEYKFRLDTKTDITNTNDQKGTTQETIPSLIGWFNEVNKTGIANGYNIDSVTYTDNASATVTTGLIKDDITDVEILVRNTGLFASGTHDLIVKVSKLPEETEYKDTVDTFAETHILATERATLSGGTVAGSDFIKNLAVTPNATTPNDVIDINFQVDYSAAQQLRIDDGDSFLITIEIGTPDSLHLIADTGSYIVDTNDPDLFGIGRFKLFNLVTDPLGNGFTELKTKILDNIRAEFDFTLNLNNDALLKNFEVGLYARDSITGNYFALDRVINNFETVVISGGVQQINVNTTRGFKLASGDEFNKVEVNTGTQGAGIQRYDCKFGLKVTWQDYLFNSNADPVFFDNTKPNDNLNFKASNYSGLNDYEIVVGILATVSNGVTDTDFEAWSPAIAAEDYDVDANSAITFGSTDFKTYKLDTTEITPNYSSNENTVLEVTFNPDSPINLLDDVQAQVEIWEFENGVVNNVYQINSVNDPLGAGNILQPLSGETKLKVTNNGTTVVCECQLDNDNMNTNSGFVYSISGRIFNGTASIDGKTTEDDVIKNTEGGSTKTLDTP